MDLPVLFARQPIFDQQLNTYAYHLLYRDSEGQGPELSFDGVAATTEVLVNAYSHIMEKGQVKYLPALINFDAAWLYDGQLPTVPPETLILDIENPQHISAAVTEQLEGLSKQGYRISVAPDADDRLLQLATIIKVDIQQLPEGPLPPICLALKQQGKLLMAEKVEDYAQFRRCEEAGFDLFHGYFFARPQPVSGKKLERNELVMLQLIGEVYNPQTSPESLEDLIQRDPMLTASLLKLVNSAVFRGKRTIANIAEAVVVLGIDELRKWVVLLSLTGNTNKPDELIRTLLIRGRMCALAAERDGELNPGTAFLTGLLSGIDALLDIPRAELLEQIPVPLEVKRALKGSSNALGVLLQGVLTYAEGEIPKGPENDKQHIDYWLALKWLDQTMENLD